MRSLGFYLHHPNALCNSIVCKLSWLIPNDRLFLKLRYRFEMGRRLNLDNPTRFTEKLQWLKLYNRKPEYSMLVDKYAVKGVVASLIGDEYIIPTLGVWNTFDDIDFDQLPNQFVLKTTHGGGGNGIVICRDKSTFDFTTAKRSLDKGLKLSLYPTFREWVYKAVRPRIIAEKYISSGTNEAIKDYKIFCFDGEPKFFKVDFGRFVEHHANYYDLDWNILPFGEDSLLPVFDHVENKPENFNVMLELARKLSHGKRFLRVDLYNVNGQIYFGELTFFPASGLLPFVPDEWDEKIGNLLKL